MVREGCLQKSPGRSALASKCLSCPLRERKTTPSWSPVFLLYMYYIRQEECITSIAIYLRESENQELSRPCYSSDSASVGGHLATGNCPGALGRFLMIQQVMDFGVQLPHRKRLS